MGLAPSLAIGKLVISTNSNDILVRVLRSGLYEQVDSTPTPTPDDGLGLVGSQRMVACRAAGDVTVEPGDEHPRNEQL